MEVQMLTVKGRYNGYTVILDSRPLIKECDVIVNFPDIPVPSQALDDGSLTYLFRDYIDDGIREPIVDFGNAVGNEKW
jgi:hypothetical protein